MSSRFFTLGAGPHEIKAAVELSHTANVLVTLPESGHPLAKDLRDVGFFHVPEAIDCSVPLPFDPEINNAKWRKNLAVSLDKWAELELSMELSLVNQFGEDRIIDDLYYPVIVRELYAKGISPFQAMNESAFRKLLSPKSIIALVFQKEQLIGGGVLKALEKDGKQTVLTGNPAKGLGMTGLVYALGQGYENCKRAFFYYLIQAGESAGFSWVSLGLDQAWFDWRYLPAFLSKVGWAGEISFMEGRNQRYLSLCDDQFGPEEGYFSFFFPGPGKLAIKKSGFVPLHLEAQFNKHFQQFLQEV